MNCAELLDPNAALQKVKPWYRVENPLAAEANNDLDYWLMKHKFGRAFTFSADGKYVAVHHQVNNSVEQVSLRSLETGEHLSSILWQGVNDQMFLFSSVAFDGVTRRIVGLIENVFTDKTDEIVNWDGQNKRLVERIKIQPPRIIDRLPRQPNEGDLSFKTAISIQHPYYLRTRRTEISYDSVGYSAEIVNWQDKQILQLTDTAKNFYEIIQNPFSSKFGYAAVVQNDAQTIELISFDRIAQLMNGQKPRGDRPQFRPEFNAQLAHDTPIKKAILSKRAPFLVTQTSDGLHIWNAQTGAELGSIKSFVRGFRLFDQTNLLAYTDENRNLVLYSLDQGRPRPVATFHGFTHYRLQSRLENRSPGVTLLTLDDGSVFKIVENQAHASRPVEFKISNTGIRRDKRSLWNDSYLTAIQTLKGKYFANIYDSRSNIDDSKALVIDVFDGSGTKIKSLDFSMRSFFTDFRLDPTGQTIVYTSDEVETGIIHLSRLLKDHDI